MDIDASPGDTIVVDAVRLDQPRRTGEVLEVLGQPPRPRYRVRWNDGHESLFSPGSNTHTVHRSGA